MRSRRRREFESNCRERNYWRDERKEQDAEGETSVAAAAVKLPIRVRSFGRKKLMSRKAIGLMTAVESREIARYILSGFVTVTCRIFVVRVIEKLLVIKQGRF